MNEHGVPQQIENPFATRHVRPGALPYLFSAGENTDELVKRLRNNGWWGQIIGPHGSGKSALLASLAPAIERAGRKTFLVELHDRQRRLPSGFHAGARTNDPLVVIVDGYEQLGRLQRFRLKRFCRRGGLGLLASAHKAAGLPELFQTSANLDVVQQLVERLQAESATKVGAEEVAERFARHGGNVREILFDLYDLYEARRRHA